MKFILFNLVVGVGLIYLFTANPEEINQVSEKAKSAMDHVTGQVIEAKAQVEHKLSAETIEPPKPVPVTSPKPITAPELRQQIGSLAGDIPPPSPPLPVVQEVTELDIPRPNDAQTLLDAEADYAAAGAEPQLMSAGERRRELSILAEDMEALYLDLSLD